MNEHHHLQRKIDFGSGVAIVVGTMIGTGVFLKSAKMSAVLGSPLLVVAAWIFAGALSAAGALTYTALVGRYPEAGGEFVYLRHIYGRPIAFLYGWMRLWIAAPGSIAAYAAGCATFFSSITSWNNPVFQKFFAVSLILFFSLLNCRSVKFGARVQTHITILKVGSIALLALGAMVFSRTLTVNNLAPAADIGALSFSSFGVAVVAALWAYDGWNNIVFTAGEVENPKRTLPKAIAVGVGLVTVLYVIINIIYLITLPISEVASAFSSFHPEAPPLATKVAQTFLGSAAAKVLALMMMLSALGAMNGSILTSSRVPFAMAKAGLFFSEIAAIHQKSLVPVNSILLQAFLSSLLVIIGNFDELTEYVLFSAWIFYGLTCFGVIVLSRKDKSFNPPQHVLVLASIFCVVCFALLLNTLISNYKTSIMGLIILAAGLPVYLYFERSRKMSPS